MEETQEGIDFAERSWQSLARNKFELWTAGDPALSPSQCLLYIPPSHIQLTIGTF